MKLIDLDKAIAEAEDECKMSDDWKVSHEMMNVFKYQPIVKAIPAEWIDKWGRRNTCLYGSKDNVITIMLREWECVLRVEQANKMLEDWEKENERV